jgi:hypothetical protein
MSSSKFTRPTRPAGTAPSKAAIDRVIGAAEAKDGGKDAGEVRFTMTLPQDLADDIDSARKRAHLTRLGWIRLAITEKLEREGR